MGGREAGGMATLLPGHRDPANAAQRGEVAALWGLDASETLPGPGHTALALFEAAARGEIKALWIACTNPAQSLPDQALVHRALAACELVVLQEAFAGTATEAYADWLLPAASWGEKEGTVTNSERRISRVRAALAPPGEARADWRIVRDLALRLEPPLRPGLAPLFRADDEPESLWLQHRETTRGRDLDIGGLSWATLDRDGPQQWPYVLGPTNRLYTDARFAFPDGRARFIAKSYQAPAERLSPQRPFALLSSRLRDQWHGMSRSGRVPTLFAHTPQPTLRLHPQDAARRGLADGALVRLSTARGAVLLPLQLDRSLRLGAADLPMHWGPEFLRQGVNQVSASARCPDSQQPELKFSAAQIEAVELPWRVSAGAFVRPSQEQALRSALRALMVEADQAHCLPAPQAPAGQCGWALEAAFGSPPAPEWV